MILRWVRLLRGVLEEYAMERRRIEVRRLFREKGWTPTIEECGALEKVIYGDRKAFPEDDQ